MNAGAAGCAVVALFLALRPAAPPVKGDLVELDVVVLDRYERSAITRYWVEALGAASRANVSVYALDPTDLTQRSGARGIGLLALTGGERLRTPTTSSARRPPSGTSQAVTTFSTTGRRPTRASCIQSM